MLRYSPWQKTTLTVDRQSFSETFPAYFRIKEPNIKDRPCVGTGSAWFEGRLERRVPLCMLLSFGLDRCASLPEVPIIPLFGNMHACVFIPVANDMSESCSLATTIFEAQVWLVEGRCHVWKDLI